MAFILAFIAFFVHIGIAFQSEENAKAKKKFRMLGWFYLFITLCQGLSLLQLSSNFCKDNPVAQAKGFQGDILYNNECAWSTGIKCNIAVTCMYFVAGAMCFCVPGSTQEVVKHQEQEEEAGEYEETAKEKEEVVAVDVEA